MADHARWQAGLYQGLRELAESAFPKRCATCGRVYASAEEFLRETRTLRANSSGLKQSVDDDGSTIVELYRNCACGSTLMDFFVDRRDMSEAGLRRRRRFGELLERLVSAGLEREVARAELIKIVHGQPSEILRRFTPTQESLVSDGGR